MNKESFYQGILAELTKSAEEPLPEDPNHPKKKSPLSNPWLWGGLGAAGLGAYGLYKGMQGQPTATTPSTPPSTSPYPIVKPIEPTPNNFDKATDLGNSAASKGYTGALRTWAASKLPFLKSVAKATPYLSTVGTLGNATSMIADAANPSNVDTSTGIKAMQGGIGALEGASALVSNPLTQGVASKVLPGAVMRGASAFAGAPLTIAYQVGQQGRNLVNAESDSAAAHSQAFGSKEGPVERLVEAARLLKTKDPTNIAAVKEWFKNPATDFSHSPSTAPGSLVNMGYNTTFGGALGLADVERPNFDAYNHMYEMIRQRALHAQ